MSTKVDKIFCNHFIKETVLPEYPPLQCTVLTAAPGRGRWEVGGGGGGDQMWCGEHFRPRGSGQRGKGGREGRGDLATTFYWMVTFHQL